MNFLSKFDPQLNLLDPGIRFDVELLANVSSHPETAKFATQVANLVSNRPLETNSAISRRWASRNQGPRNSLLAISISGFRKQRDPR